MGNCNFKTEAPEKTSGTFNITFYPMLYLKITIVLSVINFNRHYVVGKGGFGRVYTVFIQIINTPKVWKVERKKTRALYAMKQMSKAR